MSKTVKFSGIEDKIMIIRNQQVIIDSEVASLYGVETMRINEAVKNNPDKFPEGYVIELTKEEKKEVIENFDNLIKLKYSPALPKVFTEKGLYMLATILKSPNATQTTISIVETFAKIRELSRTVAQLSECPNESKQKSLMQRSREIITDILDDDLKISGTETSVELNLAVLKLKHTIKRN
ncbi:MAG: ORF6N domain-containing protein [Candidatus Azobacteroides sp.]|nr:ORF6N domain-containing protein [Candidatus Azobacteroides sp.]